MRVNGNGCWVDTDCDFFGMEENPLCDLSLKAECVRVSPPRKDEESMMLPPAEAIHGILITQMGRKKADRDTHPLSLFLGRRYEGECATQILERRCIMSVWSWYRKTHPLCKKKKS